MPLLAPEKESEFVLIALTGLAKDTADPAMEAMRQHAKGGGEHEEREGDGEWTGWVGWGGAEGKK